LSVVLVVGDDVSRSCFARVIDISALLIVELMLLLHDVAVKLEIAVWRGGHDRRE
jgi:hypothetical protein